MASDFDDIFGDLKEDEQFSATLPSDFDEASIFGDSPSGTFKTENTSKPTTDVSIAQISLDDDDDDDDFLEKIVENAKKKAAGSRESSNSAVHIKSQSSASQRELALDVGAVCKAYRDTGEIPAASRLALWRHALQPAVDPKGSISMYALQTTPLDLTNQPQLRKEVESLCGGIFASKSYLEIIKSAAAEDSADGARLQFIDNAEILLTHLCKKLCLDSYPAGLALTFAPLIATSGNDPLRLELVETLFAVCRYVLPHLPKHVLVHSVADARRPLLKWLLLYHAPEIAFHLDQHFHTWNLAVAESSAKSQPHQQTIGTAGAIRDTWVASMFESESYHDFDFLTKIWDCCLLAESSIMGNLEDANATAMSTCMSFIVVHLIAARAGKKLLRMVGDQLRHCMEQTLVDALKEVSSGHLTQEVQRLIDSTPPGFRAKLCEVGYAPPPPVAAASTAAIPSDNVAKRSSTANLGMSLISASTTGVKELSSAMIDMPTKLLFMGSSLMTSGSSAASAETKDEATPKQSQLFQQIAEAGDSASLAMRLAVEDVIPLVFRSFQAPIANEKIRYFIVDCRSEDELRGGQIPTAFHFDPDAVTDRQVLEQVLATLNPLKGRVHLCVMGHGYGRIVDELRQQQQQQQGQAVSSPFALKADLFEAYATNLTRVNSALLFLTKQGFPFVSVLDGGYAAAHSLLYHSKQLTVDDLIDHDAAQCEICQHHRCMTSPCTPGSSAGAASLGSGPTENSDRKQESFSRGSSAASDANSSSAGMATSATMKTASGQLDAKALFDAHTANPGNSYFSSFTGALKTGGKTFMNPADSLKDSTKWLMKKSNSASGGEQQAKAAGTPSLDAKSSTASALPNFNKLRNSLVAMGSESLDLLKKAEQAAVAKTRVPFGGIASVAASATKAAGTTAPTSAASAATSGAASNRTTGASGAGAAGERNASFQRSEEEVFTIDDDDEEDDFVGGGGGGGNSRTSSSSSSARNESFNGAGGIGSGPTSPVSSTPFTLHTVERGEVKLLKKGMRVSRVQMLPCVESPFFSGYKKKKLAGDSAPARVSMLPRRLVIAESHLVVLKAERNMDDVYLVKSCHLLSHVARMTCLKKNALMVTLYYKWKAESDGHVVEKRNAYEVQQRDEFIKAVKGALEKM